MNLLFSPSERLQTHPGWRELTLLLFAAVFVFFNAIALSLIRTGSVAGGYLWAAAVWLLLMAAAHFLLQRFQPQHDPYLLPIIALLTGWGLLLVQRLAPAFLTRQVVWLGLATAVMLATAILPRNLRWLRRYRYTLLITGLLLLGTTLLFGVNPSGFGEALWLPIPIINRVFFQPSELLKLLLVIFLASYFEERGPLLQTGEHYGRLGPLPYLAPLLLMWGFCMILLVWQQDLGAATIFFILFLALLYLATGSGRYLLGGAILLLLAGAFAYFAFDKVTLRFDAWWNPWPDASGRAYQIVQSLYALAAGGIGGQGIAQGFPEYIPVVHSDFVFAAIAEEWGLIGSMTILICFMILAGRGLLVALAGKRPFARYLAAGITFLFAGQTILIMGGVTKLLPLTGVTLPFVSYGGSSLLISSCMAGLLLYLSAAERGTPDATAQHRLQQVTVAMLVGFTAVALSLVYWSIFRAPTILSRDDNPRLVEAELRIQRGAIFDRDELILAETVGPPDNLIRQYPINASGPAVGYYSFRHSTSGIEEGVDDLLRGEPENEWTTFWQQTLHETQTGRDVKLTLDAGLQQTAADLLGSQKGAVILLNAQTGEILAMVSRPDYDPNLLDEQFDELVEDENAPLLNRAVQGQYQPGLMLQPLILAAAVEEELITLEDMADQPNRPISVNDEQLQCATPPGELATWEDVLHGRCPGPMQDLAAEWGLSSLDNLFNQFGFAAIPTLPLNTEINPSQPLQDPLLAGIGQDNLVVTPLQLALAWGSLAQGVVLQPQLVAAVTDEDGDWQTPPVSETAPPPFLSSSTLTTMRHTLSQGGVVEFSDRVLSGPEGSTNSWYMGMASTNDPQYLVVVVVEESEDVGEAEIVGRGVLETAVRQ
ncbi:MAG: FtsW/RodA/SpoVE family cell cycle protein [Chloroflexi bacterium]|nr:FtsW/RodA/SpoVE family cell cycle protein [Chloroflexota bacterium]